MLYLNAAMAASAKERNTRHVNAATSLVDEARDAVNLVKDVVGVHPSPSWQLRQLTERCGLRA
ncbi:hypothetical protein GCM10027091_26130 [Streptomyces daliensis]